VGHSVLSERLFLRPLNRDDHFRKLFRAQARAVMRVVFHLPSVIWAIIGLAVFVARLSGGNALLSAVAVAIFAISGLGNLAALRKPHFGGLMLLAAAGLTFADWAVHE
jgi:hypothetical protein